MVLLLHLLLLLKLLLPLHHRRQQQARQGLGDAHNWPAICSCVSMAIAAAMSIIELRMYRLSW